MAPRGRARTSFFNCSSRRCGSYYIKKGAKNIDKVHNGELIHKLLGLWNEIEVTSGSIQQIKDMMKSKTVATRAMYKDTHVSSR